MQRETSLETALTKLNAMARTHALPLLLIGLGTYFRLVKYLFNRSLWLDEARLALNIVERSYAGFFQPLSYNQAAPPLFMVLEKMLVQLFGRSEYTLRLLPLAASLAGLCLFYLLARKLLDPVGVQIAVALFAVADPLIFFASELKQYSTDVLCAVGLFLLIDRDFRQNLSRSDMFLYATAGALALWLSFPAVFILSGAALWRIGVALAAREREVLRQRLPVYASWGFSFLAFYLVIRGTMQNEALLDFWEGAFMPLVPLRLSLVDWLLSAYSRLFADVLDLASYSGATALFLLGLFSMLRRSRDRAVMLAAPILITLAASSIQAYPFKHRLLLFMAPSIGLVLAEGVAFTWNKVDRIGWLAGVLLASIMLYQPLRTAVSISRVPHSREELRPLMARMKENIQAGDEIYLYYNAQYAYRYYQEEYGLERYDTTIGIAAREAPSRYLEDLQPLYGEPRVWFVFSHGYNEGPAGDEWALILGELDCHGLVIDRWKAAGAVIYLYDLSLEAERNAQRSSPHCP